MVEEGGGCACKGDGGSEDWVEDTMKKDEGVRTRCGNENKHTQRDRER